MAYMNQEQKKEIVARIKKNVLSRPEFKKMKLTFGVKNFSTFVANIKSGNIDFGSKSEQVNPYWISENCDGLAKKFLEAINEEINKTNYDKSDIMTDYFNVGFFVNINVGKWNKPYELN